MFREFATINISLFSLRKARQMTVPSSG